MESQVISAHGQALERQQAPTPEPRDAEVLVRVEYCGVCHSDLHLHEGGFELGGGAKLPTNLVLPHTLGHEVTGEVVALGPDAKGVKIGDHRAVFPWIGCGLCAACIRGEENLCDRPRHLGCSSGRPGGYATHLIVPHPRYLIDYGGTPASLAATYMCSGLTAYSALNKLVPLGPKNDVLVIGAGGVGMMGVQFAKHLFRKTPLVADIDERRRVAAQAVGAKATYDSQDPGAIEHLRADTGGGVCAVVDFVGSEQSFAFASQAVRRGGKIVIVGLFGGAMSMPIPLFPLRGLTLTGSYVGTLAEARAMMELVRSGHIDPIPIREAPLATATGVLSDLRAGKVVGRVVLVP